MNESMSEGFDDPRGAPVKYRIQIRNRKGIQGREAMIVCQNFHVNRYGNITYTDSNGLFRRVTLKVGDYFDVKVMSN